MQRTNGAPLLIASQNGSCHLHVHAQQQVLENLVVAPAVAIRLDEIALESESRSEALKRRSGGGGKGLVGLGGEGGTTPGNDKRP